MSETTADIARFRRHDERTPVYDLVIVTDEDKATQTVLDNGEIAWRATIRYDRLYRESDPARDDRECGGNRLLIADASFRDIQVMEVGERRPERGVSSIKLLPGRENELIGLKSVEIGDHTETYLFCFDPEGRILQDDVYVGPYKCEGVEIL